jgi:hypothetical protein
VLSAVEVDLGAALLDGESEDDCSSAFNIEAPGARIAARKFCAD